MTPRNDINMQKPDIIFENEDFVAVNKPRACSAFPTREGKEPSLKSWLKEKYGAIFTVHRLDRDTSGIIVFARHEASHKIPFHGLRRTDDGEDLCRHRTGQSRTAAGKHRRSADGASAKKGVMYVNKKGKASLTDYEVQEDLGLYSLLQFRLHTGRTHQIRVHMQSLGHPIVCDELYGDARPILISSFKKKFKLSRSEEDERPILQRLALHSQLLHFKDGKGEYHTLEAPLPKDMRALLQQLRKWTHSS